MLRWETITLLTRNLGKNVTSTNNIYSQLRIFLVHSLARVQKQITIK
jgi:hypothetical protein